MSLIRRLRAGTAFLCRCTCLLPALLLAPPVLPAGSIEELGRTAEVLLQDGRHDELEQLAAGYIRNDARLLGGNAALYQFYGALGSYQGAGGYGYSSGVARERKLGQLEQWLAHRPASKTARIALAQFWSIDAWKARGGEYASQVDGQAWKAFGERLDQVSRHLAEASEAQDPHLHHLLIETAKGKSAPRPVLDALYARAIQQYPAYFHYYSQRAVILQERWRGQKGELAAYAQSLLEEPGGDAGLVAYAYVANVLMGLYPRHTLLRDAGLHWPTVKAAYEARLRGYGLRNRDWNALCNLALAGNDRATAERALQQIGTQWDPVVWQEKSYFDAAVAWIRPPPKPH